MCAQSLHTSMKLLIWQKCERENRVILEITFSSRMYHLSNKFTLIICRYLNFRFIEKQYKAINLLSFFASLLILFKLRVSKVYIKSWIPMNTNALGSWKEKKSLIKKKRGMAWLPGSSGGAPATAFLVVLVLLVPRCGQWMGCRGRGAATWVRPRLAHSRARGCSAAAVTWRLTEISSLALLVLRSIHLKNPLNNQELCLEILIFSK